MYYSKQVSVFQTPFIMSTLLKLEITVWIFLLSLPVHAGSLKRIYCGSIRKNAIDWLCRSFGSLHGHGHEICNMIGCTFIAPINDAHEECYLYISKEIKWNL